MKALGRLQPEQGIAAMQAINVTVLNPWFFTVFFGTGVGCIFLAVFALSNWSGPVAAHLAVGGMLYIVGCIFVTMVFNVPLNNALARADANNPDSVSLWRHYLHRWTFWNHVGTGGSEMTSARRATAVWGKVNFGSPHLCPRIHRCNFL